MQITKETVIAVAVHIYTHTDNLKNNKNKNFKGNTVLTLVHLLTQGDIVLSFCV